MNKMLSVLFAICVAAFCVVAFTSCERRDVVGGGYSDRSNFNELGTFPLVREMETITVMTYDNTGHFNGYTNPFTSFFEEKTNVRVRWIVVPVGQFKERVSLALASGEQIDVIISGENSQANFTRMELSRLSQQGVILPIQDLIETDTVYFRQRIDTHEGWRESLTLPSGNIYAIPSFNDCFHCRFFARMFVNKRFLENLNLDIPQTTEEFKQMLIAFRDYDADGDGNPNNEIPLMGAIDNFGSVIDTFLISAFIFNDGENRLFLDNGRVVASFAQPEFREGLRFLRELFVEGLLSRDSFIASRADRARLNSSRYESIIGAMPNFHNGNMGMRPAGQQVRWLDYYAIPPLIGPTGLRVTRYDPYERFMWAGVIPYTSRNPALVMRWLDWFMSDEGTRLITFGEKGVGWDDPYPEMTGPDGRPATKRVLDIPIAHPNFGNVTWGPRFPNYRSLDFRHSVQEPEDPLTPDGSARNRFELQNVKANYVPFAVDIEKIIPPLFFPPEVSLEMSALVTGINMFVEESIARFVVGTLCLDRDWDSYMNNLRRLGLERYLYIMQTAYEASPFYRMRREARIARAANEYGSYAVAAEQPMATTATNWCTSCSP